MRNPLTGKIETIIGSIRVLVIEDNPYLRKLVRNLLVNVGVKKIEEVEDALSGFESIKTVEPDIVMLEWDMPLLNGAELVRIIRAPGMLARAEVPIIMFSASAPRGRVAEAKRLGVDAYLTMPISAKALLDRIISVLVNPRRAAFAVAAGEAESPAIMLAEGAITPAS